jgi:transketolase
VKIIATHAGLRVGPDGASHQAMEDIALMRVIPNIKIIVPCDGPQTKDAIITAYENPGPFYVRLSRPKFSTIENKGVFKLGVAQRLRQGDDAAIFACGAMVKIALDAAQKLSLEGIKARVVNIHSLRPIDSKEIISAARETKGIVVCEEHSTIGGLASAISEIANENCAVKLLRLGVKNRFGQSGEQEELFKEYLLTSEDIITSVRKLLKS